MPKGLACSSSGSGFKHAEPWQFCKSGGESQWIISGETYLGAQRPCQPSLIAVVNLQWLFQLCKLFTHKLDFYLQHTGQHATFLSRVTSQLPKQRHTVLSAMEIPPFLTFREERKLSLTGEGELRVEVSNGFPPSFLASAFLVCKCHAIDCG